MNRKRPQEETPLSHYFDVFRRNTVGYGEKFNTVYGEQELVYADWIASGRLYAPIEKRLSAFFGPFVGNTHTETTVTGTMMTRAYHEARELIKRHVNASPGDVILMCGSGMTGGVVRLQRILGIKVPEQIRPWLNLPAEEKPVVFVTHMEHHSNHTTWLETIADVEIIRGDDKGEVDLGHLDHLLEIYADRKHKMAAVSACSNVTGLKPPYHEIARRMHLHGGVCFVDFACSAPYVHIDMHPEDPLASLDAIFFSPHKFLGGPGSSGVLIFNSDMYKLKAPDTPGGGTVLWTNAWKEHQYYDDIETREDGGTPPFLQTIRAALAVRLKEEMGVDKIEARERELMEIVREEMVDIPGLHILQGDHLERLGVVSFYMDNVHYNLVVRLLNDRFGIQTRGGCACAGTYGHYLFYIKREESKRITDQIDHGNLSQKPGFVRLSLHPTMTNAELFKIIDALRQISVNIDVWRNDYRYDPKANEFRFTDPKRESPTDVKAWFANLI